MSARPAAATGAAPARRRRRGWKIARRLLLLAFFGAVAWLVVGYARDIDWPKVVHALRSYAPGTLALAALAAAAGHLVYSSFDLLGRRWTGHGLPARRVMPVTFVSYAFNLNIGSLIGGVGFRYRLYSRLGLDNATITRVLGLSLVTNWLGYLVLAGTVFALRIIAPPDDWRLGAGALQALGVLLLVLAAAYLLLCAFSPRRAWSLRGHEIELPPTGLALMQLLLSCANWMLLALVPYVLLRHQIGYASVLGALLVAAMAGVLTHIPAGLGVLEAVFIALLQGHAPRGVLLAALLAYRALYYLVPLAVATVVYLLLEARARRQPQPVADGGDDARRRSPA